MKKPSVTILYHFFHPDDVVGARQFSDFAKELVHRGWDVTVLTSNRYWGRPKAKIATAEENWNGVRIIRVARFGWNQAHDFLRIGNALWMMMGWLVKLLQLPRTDVIVVGSDPQFSQLIFPAIKTLIRPKLLVHWCFDLFPDAILADGVRGPVRWGAKLVRYVVRKAYQPVDLMVDLGPCMRRRLSQHDHNARCETLTPWALFEPDKLEQPDLSVRHSMFGDADLALLYSGNMGKAHDFMPFLQLARVLNRINPRIIFCFACRGNRMAELKQAITPRDTNIRLIPFTDESQLGKQLRAADIHLLSLRPEWEGIVVPSKFFGSLAVGRPVLYAGPEDSSIAAWVRELDLGLLLTDRNFRDVTEQVLAIAKDPRVLALWQKNAFEAYQHHFSRKNIMDAWNAALRDELQRGLQALSSAISIISDSQSDKKPRVVTGT
ncbi:MAG TPA: glycosyltransferase family 4 protein [Syntrophorhabdales bacterium]|nr:glycosyltransferase family 4 protein [Syntrophorhabdales bacterium]